MTDYGHDLLFGTFLTPSARDAHRVIRLAVTADRAGLDLVTFQDHPYQSAFLDTWTLIAHAAALTERVRFSGNVLSLPLRPPTVLARSVASLDILTGGRVELGLGAGTFWDAVVAMGGRRLEPGQAVDALAEAIAIIRDLWAVDHNERVRHEGTYYRAVGAKRGPRPAHDIQIWVGAYQPRMLALTASVGDGWLPTYEYLEKGVDSLSEANRRIDDAAATAGRAPADVRRLLNVMNVAMPESGGGMLNGPVEQWVDQIADLALNHGVSAFLMGGDDETLTRRLAEEVAPAARQLVATERAQRT